MIAQPEALGPAYCNAGFDCQCGKFSIKAHAPAVLPLSLPPRGLSRVQAAAYVGISSTTFDKMVADTRMPRPKCIGGRKVWDKLQLDEAFALLPNEGELPAGNSLDRIFGLTNENTTT